MPATTSLKLSDSLKATIAEVAAREGKSPHALMVETLQRAMDDAVLRSQFHADGEAAYLDTVHTNAAYRADDVKAFITARAQGLKAARPQAVAFDPAKPMSAKTPEA